MKKLPLIILAIFCFWMTEGLVRPTSAQFFPYGQYSNNRFVNSNLNLFFQKRWQVHRLRAQGNHQVVDALEGRTSSAETLSKLVGVPLNEIETLFE